MKLQQLLREETQAEYIKRLTKTLKIQRLGAGYYSEVFQHPVYHNVVVKLCRRQDPMSIVYLRLAAKSPHNPWFPRIVGIHKVAFHPPGLDQEHRDDTDDLMMTDVTHIIFMQKLVPLKNGQIRKVVKMLLDTVPREAFEDSFNDGVFEYDDIRDFTDLDLEDWRVISKLSRDENVRELAKVLIKVGADDIHSGNVMIRPDDGHPVITDPVASGRYF